MSRFEFRVIASSWGIAIDLAAQVQRSPDPPSGAKRLASDVYLVIDGRVRLDEAEISFLVRGLRRVAQELGGRPSERITIEITDVAWVPTDYQPEGLEAAAIGWACDEFGLDPPPIDITFDREINRYLFTYGE